MAGAGRAHQPTKLLRAIAGVPLALAQAAAAIRCHLLPCTTATWARYCRRHQAANQSSAPRTAPGSPTHPQYSQLLQLREAQEGVSRERWQRVLRQVPTNASHRLHPGARRDTSGWDGQPCPTRTPPPSLSTHSTTAAAASLKALGRVCREQLLRSNLGRAAPGAPCSPVPLPHSSAILTPLAHTTPPPCPVPYPIPIAHPTPVTPPPPVLTPVPQQLLPPGCPPHAAAAPQLRVGPGGAVL